VPSRKPLAPCAPDKENSAASANVPVKPQFAMTEDVKVQPSKVDEFDEFDDDDDAVEALMAAEAAERSSNSV
jgi:uracil-DNA glycosylase